MILRFGISRGNGTSGESIKSWNGLRWEPSRNGDLFPHLYEALDLGAVTAVYDLPVRADGGHDIPELSS